MPGMERCGQATTDLQCYEVPGKHRLVTKWNEEDSTARIGLDRKAMQSNARPGSPLRTVSKRKALHGKAAYCIAGHGLE